MATLKDYRDERLKKLDELKKLGINPYPAHTSSAAFAGESSSELTKKILEDYDSFAGKEVWIAGRISSIRSFGKIVFLVIKNPGGNIQLFIKEKIDNSPDFKNSEMGLEQLRLLDIGDFIEAKGEVIKTQTGEISVDVENLRLLTKTLRPLPGRDGLTNKEERFRRRYVDLNANPDVYQRFLRRSKFWQANRDYLNKHGFNEINIPVLEHTTGGADARPFKTHMDVLDQDFYLRISHELPLKKLIGGGYEKVYDIGPRFRNEHYTDEHLPEHVALEWYWAYADWRDGMKFMEGMFKYIAQQTFGKLEFKIGDFNVDLNKKWEQWDYAEIIKKHYNLNPFNCSIEDVKKALADHKLEVANSESKARGIDKLWKNVRKDVEGPVWLINTPLFISPLSKANPDRPETVERFQPVIAGTELGNGFSELNDPLEQLERFMQQQKMRDAGDEEAMMMDIDFVEMLEYGMPPTCGWGHSERVFWLLEGVTAREGVPFPQLRMDIDDVTRGIYPEVKFER